MKSGSTKVAGIAGRVLVSVGTAIALVFGIWGLLSRFGLDARADWIYEDLAQPEWRAIPSLVCAATIVSGLALLVFFRKGKGGGGDRRRSD